MGQTQSSQQISGQTTLFEKISEDIGSGNDGDMLDMQCTLNQDPTVTPPELLNRRETTAVSVLTIQSMESTQESEFLEVGGSGGSIKSEDLTCSTRKLDLCVNHEKEVIE